MTIDIVSLPAAKLSRHHKTIVDIYESVFTLPPYNEHPSIVRQFARVLPQQMQRADVKMQLALDGDTPVGMAYGGTCSPDQWFYAVVTDGMSDIMRTLWFENAFEIIELAVLPAYQGNGIGGQLHDALLADLSHKTAVLSTINIKTAALHLYQNRGWQPIRENFSFPNVDRTYQILGLHLSCT